MSNKILGRVLIVAGLSVLVMLFAWEVFADTLSVIEVRRNIPLAEKDPVYRDYYINGGSNQGLKNHLVVNVSRKVALKDPSGTQTFGELNVPVAQLRIVQVGEKISVARLYKEIPRDDIAMLEQTGVLIGDLIEMKGSFVDNRRPPALNTPKIESASTNLVDSTPSPPITGAAATAALPTGAPVAPATPVEPAERQAASGSGGAHEVETAN